MLTANKLKIYRKYKGDIDLLARTRDITQSINGYEWSEIEKLIQDLILIRNDLVSEEYAIKVNDNLKELCDSEQTIELLREMAIS